MEEYLSNLLYPKGINLLHLPIFVQQKSWHVMVKFIAQLTRVLIQEWIVFAGRWWMGGRRLMILLGEKWKRSSSSNNELVFCAIFHNKGTWYHSLLRTADGGDTKCNIHRIICDIWQKEDSVLKNYSRDGVWILNRRGQEKKNTEMNC